MVAIVAGENVRGNSNRNFVSNFGIIRLYNKGQRINSIEGTLWLFLNALPAMKFLKLNRLIDFTQPSHQQSQYKICLMAKSFKKE
jgi:hypothetical protein